MPLPAARPLTPTDLLSALRAGWSDFRRAPLWGLGFAAVYALGGLALLWIGAGMLTWTLVLSLGFPLIAPVAAVGLYEVSRRLASGAPLTTQEVLGVVAQERKRQMPWVGMMLLLVFLFWTFLAHLLFAVFFGATAILNIHSAPLEFFGSPRGFAMAAVQLAVGGGVAFLVFALTAFALPMLLEHEIDFVTAMMTSLKAVRANRGTMLLWAAIVAGLTFAAMLPAFLGLLVALPVLGHATWHLYRRAFPEGTAIRPPAARSPEAARPSP